MTERRILREELSLTQTEAAAKSGVSLATWRRWEEDPTGVSASTRAKCERVLDADQPTRELARALAQRADDLVRAWGDCPHLSPRQASAIASVLGWWADAEIGEWLKRPSERPLHEVSPFDRFDLRVMIYVNDNKAWAAKAQERCNAVAEEIEHGVLPFDRPGCFFDELLIAAALPEAEDSLREEPELFEEVPARMEPHKEEDDEEDDDDYVYLVNDDEWDLATAMLHDRWRWDECDIPLLDGYEFLGVFLAQRHPYTWFDPSGGDR